MYIFGSKSRQANIKSRLNLKKILYTLDCVTAGFAVDGLLLRFHHVELSEAQ